MRIDLREVLRIEKRHNRSAHCYEYWVLDNRGENAVEAGPFATFSLAQDAWRRQADAIMLAWTR